ncbi:amidohydrolase family protein [Sphingomonas colocasiae]|uniref:Amidohydrolase family protein n=1 Tax=Sphingomonas colocasiae TaxID=1848973 RepID=A0ABS7PHS1_9SPHN|nr:amidohydrolase family protein [Sphingomonas colocasiae]MBY8820841.1 amidohydrolase family protein [Sphingomonas colocasiae]
MVDRRDMLKTMGLGATGTFLAGGATHAATPSPGARKQAALLHEEIATMPVDDSHCHPLTDQDAQTTPDLFLERISLAGFPTPDYFPDGVYRAWLSGDAAKRQALDRQHGIDKVRGEIFYHFRESVFVKYMTKEMAKFLGCKPDLTTVIAARNERGRDYWGYVGALFRDARIENAMLDTGYIENLQAPGIARFEDAIKPSRPRRIYRVETIQAQLFKEDIGFEELERRFLAMVRAGLDGTGNYGARSYGMKSYLMPEIGVVKPLFDPAPAKASWATLKDKSVVYEDREAEAHKGKDLRRYLLTLALEECLARDMPMQFHAGDGEAPGIILRQQDPYNLEEMVRFDRNGVMRMPKIVPIHAGYPLVGQAAWLSHLYTNCYFELSIMTPFVHQGLFQRYLQVMEAVPLSKILFGSDAYHVPELFWLASIWGKRYLAQALGVYVDQEVLSVDEAIEAARMILYKNNRRLYNLEA